MEEVLTQDVRRIDIRTAAERTGLKPTTLRTLATRQIVDAVRILNRWWFDEADVLSVARTGTVDLVEKARLKAETEEQEFRGKLRQARGARGARRKSLAR